MDVRQVLPGVWEMRMTYGRDPSGLFGGGPLPHTLWYVGGPSPALLDPGPTVVAREALRALRGLGYDPEGIEYVVPSHIHVDHGGSCGWLVRELPRATVVLHRRGAPYLLETTRLREGTAAVFGPQWEDLFGPLLPVPQERLLAVEDGHTLSLGGRQHRVLFLPGHSLDHIGVYDEEMGALYCGHALGQYYPGRPLPDPPSTLPYFDVEAALASMARIGEIAPRYVLLAHGGLLAGEPAPFIRAAQQVTREVGEIVLKGMEEGVPPEGIEKRVRAYLFGDPDKAGRSYMLTVRSYMTYYERKGRGKQA